VHTSALAAADSREGVRGDRPAHS